LLCYSITGKHTYSVLVAIPVPLRNSCFALSPLLFVLITRSNLAAAESCKMLKNHITCDLRRRETCGIHQDCLPELFLIQNMEIPNLPCLKQDESQNGKVAWRVTNHVKRDIRRAVKKQNVARRHVSGFRCDHRKLLCPVGAIISMIFLLCFLHINNVC
jgi:hypothetical protein